MVSTRQLTAVAQHKRWQAGKLSTAFIPEEFPAGFRPTVAEGETAKLLAAVAAAIDHVLGERKRRISGQRSGQGVTRERKRVVGRLAGEESFQHGRGGNLSRGPTWAMPALGPQPAFRLEQGCTGGIG